MRPIFHLSFPVRDLNEAIEFYCSQLGATIGRRTATFADALMFGAQITLQDDPSSVTRPMPRTRHFGATLPWNEWEVLVGRLGERSFVVEAATISYAGEPREQGKLMLADPSGNLIELKAYRQPAAVLGSLAE